MHLQQTSEAFSLTSSRVQNGHTALSDTGIDTEEGQFTDERVGHNLESESGERLHIADVSGFRLAALRIGTVDIPDIDR